MHSIASKSLLLGALMAGVFTMSAGVGSAAAADDRLIRRCSAEGPRDISMEARYEVRQARRKFTVEMEAAPNGAFRRGQRIVFLVAGRAVGSDTLGRVVGGDLIGELNLDTQAGPGDDEDPFPRNFPTINSGTRVQIATNGNVFLGCRLR
jgi:hypothetical protein